MRRKTGPSRESAEMVLARSSGRCEVVAGWWCLGEAQQIHHRRPRGMGGTRRDSSNRPSALLHLCSPCHAWIESNRTEALRLGYLVSQSWEPADVSVFRDGQWVFFDNEGGVHALPEEAS